MELYLFKLCFGRAFFVPKSNENKLLRQYIPKKSNFNDFTDLYIKNIAAILFCKGKTFSYSNTGLLPCAGAVAIAECAKKANLDFAPNSPWVEYSGLEPLTSTLPVSRSSQMS